MEVIMVMQKGFKPLIDDLKLKYPLTSIQAQIVDITTCAISILEESQEQHLFDGEALVLSYELLVDFHMYLLDVTISMSDREIIIGKINAIYGVAFEAVKNIYTPTHHLRLGLVLKCIAHSSSFEKFISHIQAYDLALDSLEAISAITDLVVVLDENANKAVQLIKDQVIISYANVVFSGLIELEEERQLGVAEKVFILMGQRMHVNPPPPPPPPMVDPIDPAALWGLHVPLYDTEDSDMDENEGDGGWFM